uniref:Uncharacterized protein n=2 Tax=Alexandrium monilatum TaxID=311494 RepID=A0A7S4QC36_9DINO|mmetsp:Transcript_48511/g.150107  ORF Transcript_48511/g.150107 Transcript_48511/m.150107 type:complete len:373 (+) Transcript_48511:78-1196(+)
MALQLERSLRALQARLREVKAAVGEARQLVRSAEEGAGRGCGHRAGRLARLARMLASPAVQLRAPGRLGEVPMELSLSEVARLFLDHVPGVQRFVCPGQPRSYSLKAIQSAYAKGFMTLAGTDRHQQLMWLMRLIVHRCSSGGSQSSGHLREVAEAFKGSEEEQAHTVERVGLQLMDAVVDFRGHLVKIVDSQKDLAVKALAAEMCARLDHGGAGDVEHFRQRFILDVGDALGLNQAHVQSARLDEAAQARFPPLTTSELLQAKARFLELFSVESVLDAFVSEVRSGPDGPAAHGSIASAFSQWAAERVLHEYSACQLEAHARAELDGELALALLETLFLGQPGCTASEASRGKEWIRAILGPSERPEEAPA